VQLADIAVFGATSFVGRILCRHLVDRYGDHGEVRWLMAARSGVTARGVARFARAARGECALLTADANHERSLFEAVQRGACRRLTVGPYSLYGEPLVAACASTGTDYCDLAGEVPWIRRMIAEYSTQAARSGARIVHSCGFDSIPSDMGVQFLQRQAVERFGEPCAYVKMRVKAARGGLSGGTVASLLNVLKQARASPEVRRELASHYALCPEPVPGTRQPEVRSAEFDQDFAAWAAPFLMAVINTRIVHRTNALLGHPYGREFCYDEAMLTGAGARGRLAAIGLAAGLASFVTASSLAPTRWVLERFFLPAPGEGPNEERQRTGFYDLRFLGRTRDGRKLACKVVGEGDPGYASTARMLGEAAACLALDVSRDERKGGSWTPGAIFDDRLVARLQRHAGIGFALTDD
jgi:short subunit dehydrogenase-like uncharacterized protein